PPTLLNIPKPIKPYQTLLKLYGVPNYHEASPLIFIFITFPLLFGLMFGDLGQGIVLIIAGLLGAKMLKPGSGKRNFCFIIAYCGIGAMFGGLLYGEFFGFKIHLWIFPIFEPFEGDIITILIFTLFIGSVQITVGLLIRAYNFAIIKQRFMIIADVIPKIGILWGSWYMLLKVGIDIIALMNGLILIPVTFIVWLFLGKLVGKMIKIRYLKNIPSGELIGENSLNIMETVISFLSNTMSYARIFAMTMVHLGFMYAVSIISKMIGDSVNSGVVAAIVYAIGNAMVIALELLLVTIQNIRLHFYEFFSKFYSGEGTEFKPIIYDATWSQLYFDNSEQFLIPENIVA
ncbi:MAG: V-type ATPase 116kDa subunit family protein, partial [Promethearchaeota archaeon]